MSPILEISDLRKTFEGGVEALSGVSLEVQPGEILALLGPNGAGKTTLISTVCGLTEPSSGRVQVAGHDIQRDFRAARRLIGLVPQEIALEPFQRVWEGMRFSRGLFGLQRDDAHLESVLRQLSLWEKRDAQSRALSGGMKRRVMIAKALAHEPRVLFLDEPTAGVDVELRRSMWEVVERLKSEGVTIILTTHYIEEAEALADRVGVISRGELLLVEETGALMDRMGRKELTIELHEPLNAVPEALAGYGLALSEGGTALVYTYDRRSERTGITRLLADLQAAGLALRDLSTRQSSLEEIFVGLVQEDAA
ncbi:ABC transporter ATP-binding protein [Rhodosalinus sp.]|uniref:ABC transporter ATP-binding protein n=1 Tax=Rhodosalinus sp. TaxID=2047741 RepID=UPI003569C87C